MKSDNADIFEKAVEGLNLSKKQKEMLLGIILINHAKTIIELLVGINSEKREKQKQIWDFFDQQIKSLPEEDQNNFFDVLNDQSQQNTIQVLTVFAQNLPDNEKHKLLNNLKQLTYSN